MDSQALVQRLSDRLTEATDRSAVRLIVEDLLVSVIDGTIEVGERLPTARELAIALRVSPRTVERAFAELERRGVLAPRPGAGTVVCLTPEGDQEARRQAELLELCRELVERASSLGFEVADVVEVLSDYETERPSSPEASS